MDIFRNLFGYDNSNGVKPLEEVTHYKSIQQQPLATHKLKRPQDFEKPKCVIYYNGTFAPVHPGHLDAIVSAKKGLEENGVN